MKNNTEIHLHPHTVQVFDGGAVQDINVLREHCTTGRLPDVARALAKGLAKKGQKFPIRRFDEHGVEITKK